MLSPQVVFNPAAAQVWTGESVRDGAILRDDADIARPIDENAVPRQELIDFVELRNEAVEELGELREKAVRQVADLAADPRVGSREACSANVLAQVIYFLALGVRV
jgi:hypothetical protein